MDTLSPALAFLLLPVVVLAVAATVLVLRTPDLAPGRRAMQVAVAWLVPVVGAIGVLLVQWIERRDAQEALDRTAFADGPCAAGGAAPGEGCGCASSSGD